MVTIKRINVGSAMRIGAITGALLSLVMGGLVFGLQSVIITSLSAFEPNSTSSDLAAAGAVSLGMMCVMLLLNVIFGAIGGGIGGLVWGVGYNLAAKWVGGIEVELEGDFGAPLKSKRSVIDSIYE